MGKKPEQIIEPIDADFDGVALSIIDQPPIANELPYATHQGQMAVGDLLRSLRQTDTNIPKIGILAKPNRAVQQSLATFYFSQSLQKASFASPEMIPNQIYVLIHIRKIRNENYEKTQRNLQITSQKTNCLNIT